MNNKVDIMLVPPITSTVFTEDTESFMPLGLMALSATVRKIGYQPAIFEPDTALFDERGYDSMALSILEAKAPIVGFSTWCHSYASSIMIAKKIKKLRPSTIIVFGGPQATILDEETLKLFPWIDFVLRGEADLTIGQLVNRLLSGHSTEEFIDIPGLTFRCNTSTESIIKNPTNPNIRNLDNLPIPAYDLITLKQDWVSLDVGRGCPFKCTFCTTNDFFSKSYRVKSSKRIIKEMDLIYDNYGITRFDFTHDMFTLNNRYLFPFCKDLEDHQIKNNRKYEWTCSARVDCVSSELLAVMAKSGCKGMFFGIESGSQRMQKIMKKNIRISRGYEIIDKCKALGIRTTSAFIAGFPEEEPADINDTINAIFEMTVRGAKPQMSLLSLLPQTPLYEQHKKELVFDGAVSDFSGTVLSPMEKELIKKYPEMFSSFYYLPIDSVKRETLVAMSKFTNLLQDFRMTVRMIWPQLHEDLRKGSFIKYFEKQLVRFQNNDNSELMGMIHGFKSYLFDKSKEISLEPVYAVFIAEVSMAIMRRKFITWQIIEPQQARSKNMDVKSNFMNRIKSSPFWTIVTSSYRVDGVITDFENEKLQTSGLQKGQYQYLIIAENERTSNIYRLKDWQSNILDVIDGETVRSMIEAGSNIAGKKESYRFLRKLFRTGAISVVPTSLELAA